MNALASLLKVLSILLAILSVLLFALGMYDPARVGGSEYVFRHLSALLSSLGTAAWWWALGAFIPKLWAYVGRGHDGN